MENFFDVKTFDAKPPLKKSVHVALTLSAMVKPNQTSDEHQWKSFQELFCSEELTRGIDYQLIFLIVLNIFLSITAFLGNALILVALHKESSLHPPSKLLLRCLATTDLCVGLISEPSNVVYWVFVVNEHWNTCFFAFASKFSTAHMLCLFTLSAISVDRLLALLLGLRYRQIVTLKRIYVTTAVFWVVSILATAMYFWNYLIIVWFWYVVISVCLVTSTFSYTKIFLTLRGHQKQVQNHVHQAQPSQIIPLNIARYRKAVCSGLWLQMALVICYLPFAIVVALRTHKGHSSTVYLIRGYAETLIYLNSSLNPILYCWKIREVRQAVKDTIRQFCCLSSNRCDCNCFSS